MSDHDRTKEARDKLREAAEALRGLPASEAVYAARDAVADAREALLGGCAPEWLDNPYKPEDRRMGDLICDLLGKEADGQIAGFKREYWICVGGDYYDERVSHWANASDKWHIRLGDVKTTEYGMTYDAASYSDDGKKIFVSVTGEWFDHVQARRHEEA